MMMCSACSAMEESGVEHAGLQSKGRRGYQAAARARMSGGEHFVCRLCGAHWRRDKGMHAMQPKKSPWPLSLQR